MAVHSLSKRSNLAGVRVGFYAGDSVGKCIRRGIADRLDTADQRLKSLIRRSGH